MNSPQIYPNADEEVRVFRQKVPRPRYVPEQEAAADTQRVAFGRWRHSSEKSLYSEPALHQAYTSDQEIFIETGAYVGTSRSHAYSYEQDMIDLHHAFSIEQDGAQEASERRRSDRRSRRSYQHDTTELQRPYASERGSRRSVVEGAADVSERKVRKSRRPYSADRGVPHGSPRVRRYSAGHVGQHRSRRTVPADSDSEQELTFDLGQHLAECRCPCDHLGYGNYRHLQEDNPLYQPDVTRANKQEESLYLHSSTPSSASATSGIVLSSKHWFAMLVVLLLAAAVGVCVPIALRVHSEASLEERLELATRVLREVPLVDGHNDLPWNIRKFLHNRLRDFQFGDDLRQVSPWSQSAWSHTDLPRLRAGLVGAQFWAAYVPCESQFRDAVQLTLEQIDVIRRLTDKYDPSLKLCTSVEDIKTAHAEGHLCSLIGVEGGHSLASSLPVLRTLYSVGVRYVTLTSTCNTPWADCSLVDNPGRQPEHNGLTTFGKSVVKEMNRLGMMVDLSHVSVRTMKDALDVSKAPIIFSHSSARALCNSTRNVPDHVLKLVALNRGLVMVNFYSQFLTCRDVATVEDAAAHINHVRKVAGVDNVGLGAGYDGINFTPQGLEDVSSYPTLFAHLIGSGLWSVEDLKKLAGLNFLRVMQEAEKVRDAMQIAGVAPYEDDAPRQHLNNCTSPHLF